MKTGPVHERTPKQYGMTIARCDLCNTLCRYVYVKDRNSAVSEIMNLGYVRGGSYVRAPSGMFWFKRNHRALGLNIHRCENTNYRMEENRRERVDEWYAKKQQQLQKQAIVQRLPNGKV